MSGLPQEVRRTRRCSLGVPMVLNWCSFAHMLTIFVHISYHVAEVEVKPSAVRRISWSPFWRTLSKEILTVSSNGVMVTGFRCWQGKGSLCLVWPFLLNPCNQET